MPNPNYEYKLKKENRNDFLAQFMIPKGIWTTFKESCATKGTTPSKVLRDFILSYK